MKTAGQRFSFSSSLRGEVACLVLAAITGGCLGRGTKAPTRPAVGSEPDRVAFAPSQFGPAPAKVISVDSDLGFVVIDFSSRVMPPAGTRLNVYRDGKNIGAVRITEPVRSRLATADIIEGDMRAGDEAR